MVETVRGFTVCVVEQLVSSMLWNELASRTERQSNDGKFQTKGVLMQKAFAEC